MLPQPTSSQSMLLLWLVAALCGCAGAPTQITTHDSKGGDRSRYYTSSDFCGRAPVAEGTAGLFAVEKGTSTGGNRLIVWLYNLGDSGQEVRVRSFSYHGARISVRKNLSVAPGDRVKLFDQSIAYQVYESDNALSYDLSIEGAREFGLLELRHQRHRDSGKARRACKAPENATRF